MPAPNAERFIYQVWIALLGINIVIWDQETFITVTVGQEVEDEQQNNGLINYTLWMSSLK